MNSVERRIRADAMVETTTLAVIPCGWPAVGCVAATQKKDPIVTAYRDHGHALARGMDPLRASASAAWLHAEAGRGVSGLVASELPERMAALLGDR